MTDERELELLRKIETLVNERGWWRPMEQKLRADIRTLGGEIERASNSHDDLLRAATEALALLDKGAPGWGVAKDLLRAAISRAIK